MGVKIVDPGEPLPREEKEMLKEQQKLVRIYKPVPMIPREEALRLRRAARNMADTLLPWAVQQLADLAQNTEDDSVRHKVLMDLVKISLSGKSNEEVDPDAPTVDGKVVEDQLKDLEKSTEKTGTDTE